MTRCHATVAALAGRPHRAYRGGQVVDESTPWWNLGVIGLRFVDLVLRYAITFVVTLAAVEASLPADMRSMEDWPGLFVLIGVPSILISFAYGLASTRAGAAFRGRLAGLLFLPLWFLPFLGCRSSLSWAGSSSPCARCGYRCWAHPSSVGRGAWRSLLSAESAAVPREAPPDLARSWHARASRCESRQCSTLLPCEWRTVLRSSSSDSV